MPQQWWAACRCTMPLCGRKRAYYQPPALQGYPAIVPAAAAAPPLRHLRPPFYSWGPFPSAAPPLLLLYTCTQLPTTAGPSLLCGTGRGIRRLMWWRGPHWTWQTRPPSGEKRPHARQHPAAARRAGKKGHTVGASMGVHGSRAARAALMLYCFCTVQGEHRRLKAETWGRVSAFSIHSSIFTLPPPHYPLWSHPSFRAFAAEYEASGRALHLLVNNAGALTFSKSHNQQGVAELCQVWP